MMLAFLTREEKLVFLTIAVCLIGGGLYQLLNSVIELPEAVRLPSQDESSRPAVEGDNVSNSPDAVAGEARTQDSSSSALQGMSQGSLLDEEDSAFPDQKSKVPASQSSEASGRLNLNYATAHELEALPGIGPALAARIIEERETVGRFQSVEDLLAVRGIGEKTLAKFRDWVYVSIPE